MKYQPRELVVALDLGSGNVRAVLAEVNQRKLTNVLGASETPSNGVVEGTVTDIQAASSAIATVLESVKQSSGHSFRHVVLGVSGQHFASLNTTGVVPITRTSRQVSLDDIYRVRDQAKIIVLPPEREITHCIPRMFRIDGQSKIVAPIGMYASRLEMEAHIVTASGTLVQNSILAVNDAGFSVRTAVLCGIAAAESVLTTAEKQSGVLSVNIGSGTSEFAVYRDGSIAYSSVVPFGGGLVTRDIGSNWGIPYAEAEGLKIRYGTCQSPDNAAVDPVNSTEPIPGLYGRQRVSIEQVNRYVLSRSEEIVHLIRLELIKSGYFNLLPAGIVLSGGFANTDGLIALCSKTTKLHVRHGRSTPVIGTQGDTAGDSYGTAVGIAQYVATTPERMFVSRMKTMSNSLAAVKQGLRRVSAFFDL